MYNTTTERDECKYCGLPLEADFVDTDKHPSSCPEKPLADYEDSE